MKIDTGVSNLTVGLVVTFCAAPAAALNIWPRVEAMLTRGIHGNDIGIVLLVICAAIGMALVPFAMKKAENFGFWLICLTFGISLAIVNYAMAVGAIGKVRDNESLQAAAIIRQAKTLQARISSAEESLPGQ